MYFMISVVVEESVVFQLEFGCLGKYMYLYIIASSMLQRKARFFVYVVTLLLILTAFPVSLHGAQATTKAGYSHFKINSFSSSEIAKQSIQTLNVTLTQGVIEPYSYEPVTIETTNFTSEPVLLNVTVCLNATYLGPLTRDTGSFHLHFILNMTLNPITDVKTITIPGLPSINRTILGRTLYVNSTVQYQALSENQSGISPIYQYDVANGSFTSSKPMLFAFPGSDMNLSGVASVSNYFGLSTPGMTAYPNESVGLYLETFSDRNVSAPHLQYSISGAVYHNLTTSNTSIDTQLSGMLVSVNDMITNLTSYVNSLTSSTIRIPKSIDPFHLFKATVPDVALGNYVSYRGVVESNNQTYYSPLGMYYITNGSGPRLFLVDPHPLLWILSSNFNTILNQSELYNYSLSTNNILQKLFSVSLAFNATSMAQFEYLEDVGETYDIYVGYPSNQTPSEISNFSPSAIVLDSLSMGYQQTGLLNWDLGSILYNDTTVQGFVINYTEFHHTGIIATGGTLSDLRLWQSPSQQTNIGSFNMVGDSVKDVNPLSPQTIAPFLGFPLLPLYELLKNLTAQVAYSAFPPAGEAIGSAPLLIPDVPWNGSLNILNNSIMAGLQSNVSVDFPNPYSGYGWNATSAIGWQLEFPRLLKTLLFHDLNVTSSTSDIKGEVSFFLGLLTSELSMASSLSNYTNMSIGSILKEIYEEMTGASTNSTNITIHTPFGNVSVQTPKELLSELPLNIVAVSPNYEAGIVTYNRYFSSNGYRSAYISFNPFLSDSGHLSTMVGDLADWTSHWKYEPTSPFHGIVAAKRYVQNFVNYSSIGTNITSFQAIVSSNGSYNVSIELNAGHYSLLYLSPYANLSLTTDGGNQTLSAGSGAFNFTINRPTEYTILIKGDSDFSMNPAYFVLQSVSYYRATFTESGLTSGTTWYVNGTSMSGHDSSPINITFTLSNGTYAFTVTNLSSYYTSTSHFTVTINGKNVTESVQYYHWAYITGILSPGNATLTVDGNTVSVSSSGHFNVSVVNGTYHVVASESGYSTYYNNFTLNAGNVQNLTIDLKPVPTTSSISSTEIYAIIGVVVAIAAVAGVIGYMRRRH